MEIKANYITSLIIAPSHASSWVQCISWVALLYDFGAIVDSYCRCIQYACMVVWLRWCLLTATSSDARRMDVVIILLHTFPRTRVILVAGKAVSHLSQCRCNHHISLVHSTMMAFFSKMKIRVQNFFSGAYFKLVIIMASAHNFQLKLSQYSGHVFKVLCFPSMLQLHSVTVQTMHYFVAAGLFCFQKTDFSSSTLAECRVSNVTSFCCVWQSLITVTLYTER